MQRLAIGGSAADPPHYGHKKLLETLLTSGQFDMVIWVISGQRPDKPQASEVFHRQQMARLAFPEEWWSTFDVPLRIVFDLGLSTTTIQWFSTLQSLFPETAVVWYTGVDSVVPRKNFGGKCDIEAFWADGEELMRNENYPFLIIPRNGYPDPQKDLVLPQHFNVLDVSLPDTSSSLIRERMSRGKSVDAFVCPEVESYMREFGLYEQ